MVGMIERNFVRFADDLLILQYSSVVQTWPSSGLKGQGFNITMFVETRNFATLSLFYLNRELEVFYNATFQPLPKLWHQLGAETEMLNISFLSRLILLCLVEGGKLEILLSSYLMCRSYFLLHISFIVYNFIFIFHFSCFFVKCIAIIQN